ncbi:MAG: hypothetical protein V4556_07420 [Bacteroidota bacterium]
MTRNAIILALYLTLGISKVSAQVKDSIIEVTFSHSPKQFICNNQLCKGKQVGYYFNGIIEIKGRFKKGRAKGKVNNYDSAGKLETVRFFKKGYIKRSLSFDSLQRLTRNLDFGKRKTTTYYYDNTGQPIKKEILIWQGADWSKGTRLMYERKNDKWVKITDRN